jgi:NAD(P)-dependent dehydrogenase (short-subunit alcohol dehydrogenase family)
MTEPATHNVLSGSDAVLVQGASRGIGLALVRRLLEHSEVGRVFATCRNPQAAEQLATLADGCPRRLSVLPLDLLDESSIAAAASAVGARAARLALVINCAGVLHEPGGMQPERRLADVKVESFVQSVRVNALGPLLMAKHFEPLLRSAQRTVFASISARVGSIGDNRLGGWYAYRASKAAQNMATRNLSIELRRRARGIICVALHPGTVDTALSEPFQSRVPSNKLFTPAQAAENLLAVVDSLDPDSNGKFYAWDGSEIPW